MSARNSSSDGAGAAGRPPSLTLAVALVALEAVAAVVAGVGFAVAALVAHPSDRPTALMLAALLVALGAGVGATALGLWRARPRARVPAYLTQFFALIVAVNQ